MFVAADLSRVPQDSEDSDSLVSSEQLLASIQSLKRAVLSIQSEMVTKDQLRLPLNAQTADMGASASVPLTPTAPSLSQAPDLASSSTVAVAAAAVEDTNLPSSLQPMGPEDWSNVRGRQRAKMPRPSAKSDSAARKSDSTARNSDSVARKSDSAARNSDSAARKSDSAAKKSNSGGNSVSKRKSNSVVIGKKVSAGELSWRGADLTVPRYIGRVALGTSTDDVKSLLIDVGVEVISLDPLPLKHNRFQSYKLVVKKSQIPLIEDPDIWPEGVMVGRWWSAKPTASSPENENQSR